jgi:hypothetical protein
MPDDLDAYLDPVPRARRGNYDEIINRHAQRTGLDPDLVRTVVHQESGGNSRAVSPKGAQGVGQLMPATAKRFGVTDPFDPEQNIRGATDYLKFLNDRFKGNRDLVLAGYNAGEGAVDKFHGVPPYRETRNYVKSINARLSQRQQKPSSDLDSYLDPRPSGQTPPAKPSDGAEADIPQNPRVSATNPPAPSVPNDPLSRMRAKYPWTRGVDINFIDSSAKGDPSRKLEFYPADEIDNPQPGKPTVELFDKRISESDLMGEILSHHLPSVDRNVARFRGRVLDSMTPNQKRSIKGDYERDRRSGLTSDSFEIWLTKQGGDSFFRGYPTGQWPARVYTSQQKAIYRQLQSYLDGRSESPVPSLSIEQVLKDINRISGNVSRQVTRASKRQRTVPQRAPESMSMGDFRRMENADTMERNATREQVVEDRRARRGPYGNPTAGGVLHLLANPAQSFSELLIPESENIDRETQERLSATDRARSPEITSIRQEYGSMPAAERSVVAPLARGGASFLQLAGGVASLAGLTPNQFSDWANKRARVVGEAASLPPLSKQQTLNSLITGETELREVERGTAEKIATGLADVGVSLGEIILLRKATRLPFGQLLALESVVKSGDKPLKDRAAQVAEAYALGTVLDQRLSRPLSALTFGAPTAAQSTEAVLAGRMSPADAAIQTGIQAATGAVLGGKGERPADARLRDMSAEAGPRTEPSTEPNLLRDYRRRYGREVQGETQSPVETQRTGDSGPETAIPPTATSGNAGRERASTAEPVGPQPAAEESLPSTPARFYHRDYGEVAESPNQRRVGKGRVRVTAEDGTEHVIKRSAMTGAGNQRAVPIREREQPEPPPVPAGSTRLYRADVADAEEPQGAGWATSPEYVSQKYGAGQMNGKESVWYRDVPTKELDAEYGDAQAVGVVNDAALQRMGATEPKLYRRVAEPVTGSAPAEIEKYLESDASDIPSATEPVTNQPQTTAPKNAAMATDRVELGLPELERVKGKSAQAVLDSAKAANTADPRRPDILVEQALRGGRNFTDTETMQVNLRAAEIKNRVDMLNKEIAEAKDDATIADKGAELDTLINEFDRLSQAQRKAGTEWGRAGIARQRAIDEDYSLVSMVARFRKDARRVETPAERAEIERLHTRNTELESKLAEANDRTAAQRSTEGVDKFVTEEKVKLRSRSRTRRTREQLVTERAALKDELSALVQAPSLKEFLRSEKGEFDPEKAGELSRVLRSLARNYIEDGVLRADELATKVHDHVKDVSDLTKREVSDLISGYGHTRQATTDPVERKLNELKAILAATSGKADVLEESMRPLRRGQQREKPTEDQRRALRGLNEAMRERGPELGRAPYDPAAQQATPLDKAKTTTRNRIEQLSKWIADGKREVEGRTQIVPDAELTRLRAERTALERVASLLDDPQADKRAIERRMGEIRKSIADTRATIQRGGATEIKEGTHQRWTPEIGALEKERQALSGVLADIRTESARKARQAGTKASFYGAEKSWAEFEKEAQRDLARRKMIEKEIADLARRMSTGDFSDEPRAAPPRYTRETARLQRELEQNRAKYHRMRYKVTRSTGGKITDELAKAANVPKTLKSIGDVSAMFRQGGYYALSHPVAGLAKPTRDMLRSFTDTGWRNVEAMIKADPAYEKLKQAGVEFTGVDKADPSLSKREEGYLGGEYLDYVPVAKQVKDFSERTFVSFLDSQRLHVGKAILDGMTEAQRNDPAEVKAVARLINIATGRGELGKRGNQLAPALNIAMFSPRLLASRVQLLNNMINPVTIARMPAGARKAMIRDNVKFLAAAGAFIGLARAAGATVSTDPDDAEFLKVRVGNTTYDTLTGLQQPLRYIVNMSRAASPVNSRALQSGPDYYAGRSMAEMSKQFARSKLNPALAPAIDFISGQDFEGRKFSARREATDLVTPLPAKDVYEGLKEGGIIGAVKATPTFVGIGVNSYPPAPDKPRTHAEKLARKYVRESLPDRARDEEQVETDREKAQLRARSRAGEDVSGAIAALGSKITERQAKAILGARSKTRLEEDVRGLGIREAVLVYRVADEEQRVELRKLVEGKLPLVSALKPDEQQSVRAELTRYGFTIPALRITRPSRESRESRATRQ